MIPSGIGVNIDAAQHVAASQKTKRGDGVVTLTTYRSNNKQVGYPYLLALIVLLVLAGLTACSRLNAGSAPTPILGHDKLLSGQGRLVCSSACAERGQCGSIADQSQVVLGGRDGAMTSAHDVYFPVNSQVQILNALAYPVQQRSGGDPFYVNFYAIAIPGGESGWVAGWCLAAIQETQ